MIAFPDLTLEEKRMLDVDVERLMEKVFAMIPDSPPKPWHVIEVSTGCVIKKYETKAEAKASAAIRNARAQQYQILARYIVVETCG